MAQENRMTVMAGSDEVYDDMSARVLSIADNDDALNDGDNQTRNAQQRHGYCTKRCKILCLAVVSVIAAVVAAVIAAVLIPKYLVIITKTRPCKILQFFTALKTIIFR